MKIKDFLKNCKVVGWLWITLRYYVSEFDEHDLSSMEQIDIDATERDDFENFINVYGNSEVGEWQIESDHGQTLMIFDLKKLVKE